VTKIRSIKFHETYTKFYINDEQDRIESFINNNGFYELDLLQDIYNLNISSGVFVDVGANIGNHTLFFANVMDKEVVSFEPNTIVTERLKRNIELNEATNKVSVIHSAVLDKKGTGKIEQLIENNLGASIFIADNDGELKSNTLDEYFTDSNDAVALIKIDVEGNELKVIKGATKLLEREKPILVIELPNYQMLTSCKNILSTYGYELVSRKSFTPTYIFSCAPQNTAFLINDQIRAIGKNTSEKFHKVGSRLSEVTKGIEASNLNISSISSKISSLENAVNHFDHIPSTISDLEIGITESKVANGKKLDQVASTISDLEIGITESKITNDKKLDQVASEQAKVFEQSFSALKKDLGKLLAENHDELKQNDNLEQTQYISALEGLASKQSEEIFRLQEAQSIYVKRIKSLLNAKTRNFLNPINTLAAKLFPASFSKFETWAPYAERVEKKLRTKTLSVSGYNQVRALKPTLSAIDKSSTVPAVQHDRTITAGIAAIKIRQKSLQAVVESIINQVDVLYVYLNDFDSTPDFLIHDKITIISDMGNIGDKGKFRNINKVSGYFFSIDDDIIYPPYYVQYCIDKIEQYNRKVVVGWHGSLIKQPFENYYDAKSRRVFSFRSNRPEDTSVHILGTGCTAFHSSTLDIKFEDFILPNMADVYFARLGQQQATPFVVLKHDRDQALPIEIENDIAINQESKNSTGSAADTSQEQNKIASETDWKLNLPYKESAFERKRLKIAYIGRVNKSRWKKGGILKSSHMIIDNLRAMGNCITPIEIDDGYNSFMEGCENADLVWIYPGDPERPDFADIEKTITHLLKLNKKVLVNLSFNLAESRSKWMVKKVQEWNKISKNSLFIGLFTNSAAAHKDLEVIAENIVSIPKTLHYDNSVTSITFEKRNGIFVGDLQKLYNENIIGGRVEEWLEAIKQALPDVDLYAVRQYGGKIDRDLGIKVIPYSTDDWHQQLAQFRLCICLNLFSTFEMIPVESVGVGTPVIHRNMPQSLSEYLGQSSIEVTTPAELGEACKLLYHDRALWGDISHSGTLLAKSHKIELAKSMLHLKLSMIMSK